MGAATCLPADAIFDTLRRGGDTDTNAAIVGGLVGALHGSGGIPRHMADPLLMRTTASPGQRRPAFLQTHDLVQLVEQLYTLGGGSGGQQAS